MDSWNNPNDDDEAIALPPIYGEQPAANSVQTKNFILAAVIMVVLIGVIALLLSISRNVDDYDAQAPLSTPIITGEKPPTHVDSATPAESTPANTPAPSSNNTQIRRMRGSIACDGRGVLIVQSIIDTGQDIQAEAAPTLAMYPTAQVLTPGACSSLRASVDGNKVYAVVIDYGKDIAGLCSAAARIGGNPRIMNNDADFTSPC